MTALDGLPATWFEGLPDDPASLGRIVQALILQPDAAMALGVPAERIDEKNLRTAAKILRVLVSIRPEPLAAPRQPGHRVVGTCRHFALLTCALLLRAGTEARVRCGFATYFEPGRGLDHWVIEHRTHREGRWVRLDPEVVGTDLVPGADDLAPGSFLTGAEAWAAHRAGEIDASTFGVPGTENWGWAEIAGNAVRDLAAICGVEMLPWDEWGRMTDAYDGRTGPGYDRLLDRLAEVVCEDDPAAVGALFRHPDLRVPAALAV